MRAITLAATLAGALATGITLSGCTMEEPMASIPLPTCPDESTGWTAWINAMPGPGSTPTLIVTGRVMVPAGASATLTAGATDRMMPPGQRMMLTLVPDPGAAGGWTDVRAEIKPALPEYRSIMIGCDGSMVAEITDIQTAV